MSNKHNIFKYPIRSISGEPEVIELPERHAIIACDYDTEDSLCIWAIVDGTPTAKTVNIEILVLPTGPGVFDDGVYKQMTHLNTVKSNSLFVWHVFLVER